MNNRPTPKFSVITITYNAEQTLPATVDSVLRQRHPNVEHLIIDGASTDGTLLTAQDYMQRSYAAGQGHDVSITSEPDNGLYYAMNKGLRQATGDYIVFLNAGDAFPSDDTLSTVAKAIDKDKPREQWPAVVYGDTDIVDSEGRFVRHRRLAPPEKLSWRSFRHGMVVCHQAFYARLDIARHIAFDTRYRYSADVDWCIRVMKEAERRRLPLLHTHATLANYLAQGQTTLHHRASLRERFRVMASHYGPVSTALMHCWFVVRAAIR